MTSVVTHTGRIILVSLFALVLFIAIGYLFFFHRPKTGLAPLPTTGSGPKVLDVYCAESLGLGYMHETIPMTQALSFPEQIQALLGKITAWPVPPQSQPWWTNPWHVRSVYMRKGGTLILDLEPGLEYNHQSSVGKETWLLRSILHSIQSNFPKINQVKILVNGTEQETLAGHVDITKPLTGQDLDIKQ
jgi:hypothetical protein